MHKIHDTLPQGFAFADRLQVKQYDEKGIVHGASKVAFVDVVGEDEYLLAVRLHPPKKYQTLGRRGIIRATLYENSVSEADSVAWYIAQYNLGWQSGKRGHTTAWETGTTNHAWDDGYLDAVAGRAKWHLTHCVNHDECGEG